MAKHDIACSPDDATEKEFRKQNLWYSFTTAAFNAFGMAAFFGVLATVTQNVIQVAAGAETAAAIFSPVPLLAIGALMAIGVAATYMSQREATELKCIQDEHLAHQNAKKLSPELGMSRTQPAEYSQNQRADGKTWQETTGRGQPQISTQLQ